MVIEIIIAVIATCVIALTVNCFFSIRDKHNIPNAISIKESLDLCNLPIVTFNNNDVKLNFIFDTGSEDNHICKSVLKKISYNESKETITVQGFNSESSSNGSAIIRLNYKDNEYEDLFYISKELDKTFKDVKNDTGVQLHGIIGNKFFVKYGYIFDFNELLIYSKS